MANRRTPVERIKEILRMHECKTSQRKIAKALRVSRPAVGDYIKSFETAGLKYADLEKMSDRELLDKIGRKTGKSERYKLLQEQFTWIAKELKRRGVTLQLLWETYIAEHPDGFSYSQYCEHFRQWKNDSGVSMHMEHRAGEHMFVDFAGDRFKYVDSCTGEIREADVFVAILGASQLTYAEALPAQKKEDWIRGSENAFRYFGGVTAAIVPDNPRAVVSKACRYEPDINPDYADFARHHSTTILPARPRKPKDKSLVENAVRLVYERIYAPLRDIPFASLKELNRAIRELLEAHNNRPMQKLKISRRQLFDEIEKEALLPLPTGRYEFKKFQGPTSIQFNYHVYLKEDRHYYSVPFQYRRKDQKIRIIYTENTVELYADGLRVASHVRNRAPHRYTTEPDHMPSHHRHIVEWTPGRFLRRAEKKGLHVRKFILTLMKKAGFPEQAFRPAEGVLRLGDTFSDFRLNRACCRALEYGTISYRSVKSILEKGLDQIDDDSVNSPELPLHENIRGKDYYEDGGLYEQHGNR